jgi:hypothetical protein
VLTIWVSGGPDLLWRTLFLSSELILYQSDHDDYAYSRGEVAMLGGDGINSSTRVLAARRVWVPMVMPCLI